MRVSTWAFVPYASLSYSGVVGSMRRSRAMTAVPPAAAAQAASSSLTASALRRRTATEHRQRQAAQHLRTTYARKACHGYRRCAAALLAAKFLEDTLKVAAVGSHLWMSGPQRRLVNA
jgi:hypothetical protein